MKKDRTILLVDMNSFFASIEQQCDPRLKGKPVAVGGPAGSRAVVSTASYEARQFGVHSAMPVMEALTRCPELVLVHGDLRKYVDISRRVFRICGDYTDLLEIYSVDECFMDVTHTQTLFGGSWNIALDIKRRIFSELGLTCSIGIGPNKVLAKLAAGMRKPDGLVEIRPEEVRDLLENLPVEKLHGIGDKVAARLRNMGISTAGALGRTPRDRLKRHFGVYGEVLHAMGNGDCDTPVVPYYDQQDIKSVGHSHTLAQNTRDWGMLSHHLLRLSEMVGRRLREQGFAGRTVSLTVRYADMHTFSRRQSLNEHIDDGYAIYQVALSILREQVGNKHAIRLVGVCVSNLAKGFRQLGLFSDVKDRTLLNTLDAINNRYGEFTIRRASLLETKPRGKAPSCFAGARTQQASLD
ncbi:MAG: DNA polymerase IV [Armatimonadota bacterium]|nr:DNA polymerase IV [bacterium]